MLPKLITTNDEFDYDPCKVLVQSFNKVNEALIMHCDHPGSNFDCLISGTTATVSYIKAGRLYSAHVGDSRGVIAKR